MSKSFPSDYIPQGLIDHLDDYFTDATSNHDTQALTKLKETIINRLTDLELYYSNCLKTTQSFITEMNQDSLTKSSLSNEIPLGSITLGDC